MNQVKLLSRNLVYVQYMYVLCFLPSVSVLEKGKQ